jgi:hypothetical protein
MRVFLACPLTAHLRRGADGARTLDAGVRRLVTALEDALRSAGHDVFLAHRLEDFGARLRPPEVCTPFDLLEMQHADVVVAVPRRSFGVHVELGWATALGIPALVLAEDGEELPPLLGGLPTINGSIVARVPAGLLTSASARDAACHVVLERLPRPRHPRRTAYALLATSFGFGPVSKAVTIARELAARAPDAELHFFGGRIDHDFAVDAGAFDRVFRIDVDDSAQLRELVPHLMRYRAVISVLNLELPTLWHRNGTPLHVVDSLAWMWPAPPAGLHNVDSYFVQRYMLPAARAEEWERCTPLKVVPPIDRVADRVTAFPPRRAEQVLVNLAGCANPFGYDGLYERYALAIADAVLAEADDFREIVFATNARLAAAIADRASGDARVRAAQFAHDEFLGLLASAGLVLSAPGITTTIEAMRCDAPLAFLPPQNYSQAMLSERYRGWLGDAVTMALSRFDQGFALPAELPEAEGVARTVQALARVLEGPPEVLRGAVARALRADARGTVATLRARQPEPAAATGQAVIAERILLGQPTLVCRCEHAT